MSETSLLPGRFTDLQEGVARTAEQIGGSANAGRGTSAPDITREKEYALATRYSVVVFIVDFALEELLDFLSRVRYLDSPWPSRSQNTRPWTRLARPARTQAALSQAQAGLPGSCSEETRSAVDLPRSDDPRHAEHPGHSNCQGSGQVVTDYVHKLQIDDGNRIDHPRIAKLVERVVGTGSPISGI